MDTASNETSIRISGLDASTLFRQIGLFVGLAASFVIAGWILLWSQQPNFNVLFPTLEETEASIVLDALQQLNIEYRLDEKTGALLVPSHKIHDAKIKLAAQGLPKSTISGFSNIGGSDSSFGMSAAKEKILFQKALERDLVNTINSISNVKSARVHLAIPKQSAFIRNRQQPRASVVVSLYSGRSLSQGQVSAIMHLVASSVPNLLIENVTIVDQTGRLLSNRESEKEIALSSNQFEYTRKIEKSYQERIHNILAPILGANAVHAQVTAEVDFTINEQTQQTFNPESQIPISVQTAEEQSSGSLVSGVPGALSNQPPQDTQVPEQAKGKKEGKNSSPFRSTRQETKNYEVDKTISHTRYATGNIKKLSAAVVVDDKIIRSADGKVSKIDRSPEDLVRITELVKKAIGFDEKRGDSVNIINESFTVPEEPAKVPDSPLWEKPWVWDLAKQLAAGLVLIAILFGVLKPAIKSFSKSIVPLAALPGGGGGGADLPEDQLSLGAQEQESQNLTTHDKNTTIAQQLAKDDPKLVAQVVKNWVSQNE